MAENQTDATQTDATQTDATQTDATQTDATQTDATPKTASKKKPKPAPKLERREAKAVAAPNDAPVREPKVEKLPTTGLTRILR